MLFTQRNRFESQLQSFSSNVAELIDNSAVLRVRGDSAKNLTHLTHPVLAGAAKKIFRDKFKGTFHRGLESTEVFHTRN